MGRFINLQKHFAEISENVNHQVILRLILHNLVGRIVCQSVISIRKIDFKAATDMMLLERIDKRIGSQFISDCNKKLLKKLNVNFFLLQIVNF
jgi:hypothetical protein